MLYATVTSVEIRKPYDKVLIPTAVIGSQEETRYRLRRDEHDNAIYTPYETVDICEYINSFRTGASLRSVLERCNLLPLHDKVRMLQQTEDGFSADMSKMPKDGTEAFIAVRELRTKYPDIVEKMKNGESFDSVISSIFGKGAANEKADPAPQTVKNDESEVQ